MVKIDTNTWEYLSSDRVAWSNLIATGVKEFENNRVVYAELKRAGKHMADVNPLPEKEQKSPFHVMNVAASASRKQASSTTNAVMVPPPPIIMISRTIFHALFATKCVGQPVDSHGITNLNILITRLLSKNLPVITVECLTNHLQVS